MFILGFCDVADLIQCSSVDRFGYRSVWEEGRLALSKARWEKVLMNAIVIKTVHSALNSLYKTVLARPFCDLSCPCHGRIPNSLSCRFPRLIFCISWFIQCLHSDPCCVQVTTVDDRRGSPCFVLSSLLFSFHFIRIFISVFFCLFSFLFFSWSCFSFLSIPLLLVSLGLLSSRFSLLFFLLPYVDFFLLFSAVPSFLFSSFPDSVFFSCSLLSSSFLSHFIPPFSFSFFLSFLLSSFLFLFSFSLLSHWGSPLCSFLVFLFILSFQPL